ncbi:TIM-barrel domain-containing protein [Paenibacillus sp. FSL W8-0194]|uniref:glycoside hydrolase family 31 protein n=1 Tax=Paenibacillus sp. FSL W8-0194 TaxID=2921711 RepID=UPI0030D75524
MEGSEAIRPDKYTEAGHTETGRYLGAFQKLERRGDAFVLRAERGGAAVLFPADGIFRIKFFWQGEPDLSSTVAIDPAFRQKSESEIGLEETGDRVILRTSLIALEIDKTTFAFTVRDKEGKVLCRQTRLVCQPRSGVHAVYDMPQDSHFYGLGEKSSFLDKRGERYTNWNTDVYAPHVPEIEALYQSIPFVIHMAGGTSCGLFLDNPGRTEVDMRTHAEAFTMGCSTGDYDLYFIAGPSVKDVVTRYTALTGRIELPPKWALGYHQSRYSYMDQEEVLELARTFREKNIPCDVIYLDIHYMDGYRVFTFDPLRFPDPEAMIKELRGMGIRIVPIVDPGVKKDPKYDVYREGVQQGHFCTKLEGDIYFDEVWPGTSAFPDFTDDRTSKWWGDLHSFYTENGIEGIWNDMNEPAVFNESKTMDLDVMHRNNGHLKTHEELHNLYGLLMSKATAEGLKRQLDNRRPFVLTRAGYAGIQRYAAVWTGDNRSFWEHMALAMPMVLNMGLSGLPFAGPDIGGFAHHTSGQLLVRWTQMGAFFPYFRNHSAIDTLRQEPWAFGAETEEIIRKYIGLRYRWLPHIYNLFQEAAATGLPVIRPLVLEYPNDPNVTNLCDQFLLGDAVLIAPVYRPDTDHRAVYLPEGRWFDYWTGEKLEGGRHILAACPLDTMPMYVKSGAIVPEGALAQHADDQTNGNLTFHIYGAEAQSGFQAEYSLYEDDGATYDYRDQTYSRLNVRLEGQEGGLKLSYAYAHRQYEANRSLLRFKLCRPEFAPSGVQGLDAITAEQLGEGAEGWHVDGEGSLIIQAADRPSGASWMITAAN